jgi:hypothetical protein
MQWDGFKKMGRVQMQLLWPALGTRSGHPSFRAGPSWSSIALKVRSLLLPGFQDPYKSVLFHHYLSKSLLAALRAGRTADSLDILHKCKCLTQMEFLGYKTSHKRPFTILAAVPHHSRNRHSATYAAACNI